ncbi:MAG: TatD family deoxyribonuclease [Gammaproteobacteria bacterium]|nr:MAG: TatD family deoxyribonuclease [Gammaproteobacteria bacterium]
MIDSHAHIYLDAFDDDLEAVLGRSREAGVRRIFMPNIDRDSIGAMLRLEERTEGFCRPMMGLHPCSVGADNKAALRQVEDLLGTGRYRAVGEIGIDLYWDKTWLAQQREAFRLQVLWAKELDLPVVIHCRDSFDETIAIVEAENGPELRGVFHCFTGTPDQAHRIVALGGFMLGIGGVITYPKGGLQETMAAVGPAHCVLETDAPYLAPVPHRGRQNYPGWVRHVAECLAEVRKTDVEHIADLSRNNYQRLFLRAISA